jgi:CRISPR-associated protein Cas2
VRIINPHYVLRTIGPRYGLRIGNPHYVLPSVMRAFYLITYDIPNDKRRLKIAKRLEALGDRVQYSVFEAWLTPKELQSLEKQVAKIIDEKEDSVRFYVLCEACQKKVRVHGRGEVTEPPGVVIL